MQAACSLSRAGIMRECVVFARVAGAPCFVRLAKLETRRCRIFLSLLLLPPSFPLMPPLPENSSLVSIILHTGPFARSFVVARANFPLGVKLYDLSTIASWSPEKQRFLQRPRNNFIRARHIEALRAVLPNTSDSLP